jgi:hypothetical protein
MKTLTIKEKTKPLTKILSKVLKGIGGVAKKIYAKIMKFDLIDGQRRSETIARRLMILLLLFLSLYILIDLLVDNGVLKTNSQRRQESTLTLDIPSPSPVIAQEDTEQVEVGNQTTENIPTVLGVSGSLVDNYVKSYGGRFTPEYLATLRKYCSEDTLELVIAISVAETGMGTARMDLKTNWWGYHYGGNKKYDPDMETMSRVICNGIGRYYSDVATNYDRAYAYTGGDDTNTWIGNVNAALAEMR